MEAGCRRERFLKSNRPRGEQLTMAPYAGVEYLLLLETLPTELAKVARTILLLVRFNVQFF